MRARKIEGERKRVRQRLAAVREPGADDLFEPRAVAHGRGRLGETPQHDDGRVDAGARIDRAEADERRGQRAGARTDLEDAVPGRIDGQPRDARGRAAVHEKMLPEPLLRANPARAEQRARMRLSASVYLMRYTVTERRPNW